MKPKPLVSLNHFTVPVAIGRFPRRFVPPATVRRLGAIIEEATGQP
jgi:hypothetical protein